MDLNRQSRTTRRRFLFQGAAWGAASLVPLAGCQSDRPFTILGYAFGSQALYNLSIHTVYVPVFHNRSFQTNPYRGTEVELTKAVIREIGAKTPYRVVSDPDGADTELLGYLVNINKSILNRDQQNEVREASLTLTVDLVWRDLRDGRMLTNPRKPFSANLPAPGAPESDIPQFDPTLPVPPKVSVVDGPRPVRIIGSGRMLQELGETNASAVQMAINQIATQVVSMMEKPWGVH